ncbi:MAG: hypothetical protein IT192_07730 [Microbacteriaceae bacterium]|nr:hypothetical protein [Microbacteriaceae bacterium]
MIFPFLLFLAFFFACYLLLLSFWAGPKLLAARLRWKGRRGEFVLVSSLGAEAKAVIQQGLGLPTSIRLPIAIVMIADRVGLSFWARSAKAPIREVSWPEVRSLEVGTINIYPTSVSVLELDLNGATERLWMSLFRLAPLSFGNVLQKGVERAKERILQYRYTSSGNDQTIHQVDHGSGDAREGSSRSGRAEILAYLLPGSYVLSVLTIGGSVALRSAGFGGLLVEIAEKLGYVLLGSVLIFLGSAVWRWRNSKRDVVLAQRPDVVVAPTGWSRTLSSAVLDLQENEVVDHLVKHGLGMSLVASKEGIEIWSGSSSSPRKSFEIDWKVIEGIEPSVTQEWGRRSRGITFKVKGAERMIAVPLIVTGAGFAGLFPLKPDQITQLIEKLENLRVGAG